MNLLDKAIGYVSPQAALRRAQARVATQALLSYEGVRSSRRQGGWFTTGTSGNAEIGPAAGKLRYNAHDLYRNNAYARRAVREWSKRVVGTGINARPDTGSDALNGIIREYWADFCANCMSDHRMPLPAAQKLIVASRFVSGEVLVRKWDRRIEDGLKVPFQIQILESDFLDSDKTQATATGYIIQGVQFDRLGRIEGYWLYGEHPGDTISTSARGLESKFIPAEYILHHLEIDRPGDARAVSRFAAVMNKLRDIDEYADAEIVRKKIEACLAAIVTQPEGADGPSLGAKITDADGNTIEKFSPGLIAYGGAGADVKFLSPSAGGDFASHKETELREVAVGLDIPYILLDDNLRAVNYSSFRGGLLAYRDAVEEYRWNWLIPQVLDPIYNHFIDVLAMMRVIPEPNYGHQWDAPPFDLLDRAAEAEADRLELQIGKTTWPQLVGAWGNDPKQHIAEITAWKPQLEAAGVTFAKSTTESNSTSTGDGNGNDQATSPNA